MMFSSILNHQKSVLKPIPWNMLAISYILIVKEPFTPKQLFSCIDGL